MFSVFKIETIVVAGLKIKHDFSFFLNSSYAMRIGMLLVVFFWVHSFSNAQCTLVGPNNGTTFTSDASVGSVAWSNPANAQTSNNSYSSAGQLIGILSNSQTHYLKCTGFGFSIPASIICGIEVNVERSGGGIIIGSSISDNEVYIVKNNSITGTNHQGGNWPGADTYTTYGSSSDNWGTTWTAADINSGNFGVAISSNLSAGLAGVFLTASVDHVRIKVYYDIPLPVQISEFNGSVEKEKIKLEWQAFNEEKGMYYQVEKLSGESDWKPITGKNANGKSKEQASYVVYDERPELLNYYRIKQTDASGTENYSKTISVSYEGNEPLIYPTITDDKINILCSGKPTSIEVYDHQYRKVLVSSENEKQTQLSLSDLPAGLYFIKLTSGDKQFLKKCIRK